MRATTLKMVDYEQTYRNFKFDIPEYFNFGLDVVDKWAEDHTKLALVSVDSAGEHAEKQTFWDLKVLSNKFANLLMELGIQRGQRAFIMAPGIWQWYVAMIGMMKLGVVPVPATALSTVDDIMYRLSRADVEIAITDMDNSERIEKAMIGCRALKHLLLVNGVKKGWLSFEREVPKLSAHLAGVQPTRADAPLLIYFTSGTTGRPKMVIHTQASYAIAQVVTARFWQDLKYSDIQWALSDTGWAKKVSGGMFGQWTQGACVLQQNTSGEFDPLLTLGILEKYGVTTFCAPPTAYRRIVLEDLTRYDLSALRHCTASGEALNPEVMNRWKEKTGLTIYDGYGQTETIPLVANYRCLPVKPGSIGKPMPGINVSIVDDRGNELPPGNEGQIAVRVKPDRPAGLFKEYWKDPEEMKSAFSDSWYFTGDNGYKDRDGYFWFLGRADDIIVSAGYRIDPSEVENALADHSAVAESGVVGIPDHDCGNIVKAFVVLTHGHVPSNELIQELKEHLQRATTSYKCPRVIEFVPRLPRTINGKICRAALRERGANIEGFGGSALSKRDA